MEPLSLPLTYLDEVFSLGAANQGDRLYRRQSQVVADLGQ
jgi:hypothetical protein